MENRARIIWFDDDYQTLENITLRFDEAGISFKAFKNAAEGIDYLQLHYDEIDALVIDGNFFLDKDNVDIDTKGKALSSVLDFVGSIKHKKDIPYYVLSGQVNFRDRKASIFDVKDIDRVYDKLKLDDLTDLCDKIRLAAASNIKRQVINQHQEVFKAIEAVGSLSKHRETIVNILVNMEGGTVDFTAIRKVLETLFVCLSELSIIPDGFTNEKGWINGTSSFLSRKHNGYEFYGEIIHPTIADALYRVLQIVQDGSHNEGTLGLRVDEYFNTGSRAYLTHSIIYSFLEVICYFGKYIQENSDININRNRWNKKEASVGDWREGEILQVATNGWGTFICSKTEESISILPKDIENYKLVKGMNIKVRVEPSPDGTKTYIKEINIK